MTHYAALDVIGNWRATADNFERMTARGLVPVPTFHKGSPWTELDRIASLGSPLMALGGMAARDASQTLGSLRSYLDRAFDRIGRHWPVRVHAFGVINQEVLERYPFYSADSTSAVLNAGMGRVSVFSHGELWDRDKLTYVKQTYDAPVLDALPRQPGWDAPRTERIARNTQAIVAYERYLTDLWAGRGIRWEDA